ncbi:hypothetical protein N9D66_00970 [Candidatus Nanopelagicales bacterium]|nr:hypothetical protein [Candidatus Nanopelagicales bacterium]
MSQQPDSTVVAGVRHWRPFLAVEAGTGLSGAANGITIVALPWLVLERTGSATAAGVLAAITAVPTMVAALLSGTIVDKAGRRKVSVISDIMSQRRADPDCRPGFRFGLRPARNPGGTRCHLRSGGHGST